MVSTTQQELKRLTQLQLATNHAKCITALLAGITATTIIPITYPQPQKILDRWVNLFGFIGGLSCFAYAYNRSNSIREFSGKLQMFNDLEKERFIQEQLLAQESYLQQLKQQYQPQYYQEENYHTPLLPPSTLIPLQNVVTIDTQASHESHTTTTLPSHTTDLVCPNCNSTNVSSNGSVRGKPRFKCSDCGKTFGAT